MSLDRSLRSRSSLARHRNVLTRTERVARLTEEESWDESQSVLGLPKVGHRKLKTAKKKAKSETDGIAEDGETTTDTPAT